VSGVWRDTLFGTQVRVSQNGTLLMSETIQPLTGVRVAQGTGKISGHVITGENRWADGSVYTTQLRFNEEDGTITGTATNAYTGQSAAVHLVR
jgi:hypothetical protein